MSTPAEPARPGGITAREVLPLVLIYVLAAATYALVARVVKVPIIYPDEFTYGHVAQSLAAGDGVAWRGDPVSLRSLLYVLAIAPSWVVSSGHTAYDIARSINAVMASLVVIPVWLVARPLLGPRLALVPALLSVAGTWMLTTAYLLTESLALPLAVASLAAMVASLRRPGGRWWIWALVLAGLAGYARLQLVALAPAFFLALLVDAGRVGPGRTRGRLGIQRCPLAMTGGLSLVGLIVALSFPDALGIYASVSDYSPGLGAVLSATGQHALALVVICGFVPAVAVLALALRGENWRDESTGPLLAVLLSATLVLVLEAGWFGAGFHLRWDIERYVEYVVPLSFVALMLLPGRASTRGAAGVGLALALSLLLVNAPLNVAEQRGVAGTIHRLGEVTHIFTDHPGLGLAFICAVIGIGGALLALNPPGGLPAPSVVLVVAGLVFAVLLAQSQTSWHTEKRFASKRRAVQPADLEWVDHHVKNEVGIFSPSLENPNLYVTEFFNERTRVRYHLRSGLAASGPVCIVSVQPTGMLQVPEGCRPPHQMLVESSFTRTTFDGERRISDQGMPNSRLVDAGPRPRVLSFVTLPCLQPGSAFGGAGLAVRPCTGRLDVQLWPATRGTFIARFQGGTVEHFGRYVGQAGNPAVYSFKPGELTTIRVPVGPAPTVFTIQLDWPTTAGAPRLQSVQLRRGSQVTDLL